VKINNNIVYIREYHYKLPEIGEIMCRNTPPIQLFFAFSIRVFGHQPEGTKETSRGFRENRSTSNDGLRK